MDGGQLLLFDLQNDPGERRDLAAQHPDKVSAMRKLIVNWETDISTSGRTP
jgi:hypothetical protein